jgi:hypothetical protein
MKKYMAITLLIMAMAWPAYAWWNVGRVGDVVPAAGGTTAFCTGAASCTASTPGQCDLLCEDFEGSTDCDGAGAGTDSNCRNGFTTSIQSGDAIDFTSTATGTYPCATTTNTNVAKITADGAYSRTEFFWDSTATQAISYVQFWFRINSESTATTKYFEVYSGTVSAPPDSGVMSNYLRVLNTSGTLNLTWTYWNGAGEETQTSSAISTATWYKVALKYDQTNGVMEWWLNGTSQGSDTHSQGSSRNPRYFVFGQDNYGGDTRAFEIEYDNITIDNDTAPGTCP